jgi:hypothetical protein
MCFHCKEDSKREQNTECYLKQNTISNTHIYVTVKNCNHVRTAVLTENDLGNKILKWWHKATGHLVYATEKAFNYKPVLRHDPTVLQKYLVSMGLCGSQDGDGKRSTLVFMKNQERVSTGLPVIMCKLLREFPQTPYANTWAVSTRLLSNSSTYSPSRSTLYSLYSLNNVAKYTYKIPVTAYGAMRTYSGSRL